MGIHRNYVNKKTHSSFLYIATIYQIWVYKRIFFMYNHISKFVIIKKELCIFYSRSFYSYKFWNMGIQGNENSFFTWNFKVGPDQFFKNLKLGRADSISHYWNWSHLAQILEEQTICHHECSLKDSVKIVFTSLFMEQSNKREARKIENGPKSIH